MSLTLSAPAVRLSTEDAATEPLVAAPAPAPVAPARSQIPIVDVVEDWGLASFPASDPPSNW